MCWVHGKLIMTSFYALFPELSENRPPHPIIVREHIVLKTVPLFNYDPREPGQMAAIRQTNKVRRMTTIRQILPITNARKPAFSILRLDRRAAPTEGGEVLRLGEGASQELIIRQGLAGNSAG